MSFFEEFDSKDIYLKKEGHPGFIGLHAIGEANSSWTEVALDGTETTKHGFRSYEAWGNEYSDEHKMVGRGSFRVFYNIDAAAAEMVADGWVVFTPAGKP